LIGGFAVILQAAVGFVIVSLYHPVFLGFNIVLILSMWLVWIIWGRGAVRSAINLSHAKHETARWLESLGASNGYFKSRKHIENALRKTDEATSDYIDASRKHFRYSFSQTIAFLVIYAAASALLLGIGGYLVIIGELSLGQLVAAELILSAVFYGVSQLGIYFTSFYDLCAAIEELSQFYDVVQEIPAGDELPGHIPSKLIFENVRGKARGEEIILNLKLPAGAQVTAKTTNHAVQRFFTNILKHHEKPTSGLVSFAGQDVVDIEVHELRQRITILDRPTLVETTIREYLKRSGRGNIDAKILDIIELVGLKSAVLSLEDGLDTCIASTGYPLSPTEVLKLKLASAIIAEPDVLVLTQLYDMVPGAMLKPALKHLKDREITVVYFTNHSDNDTCEQKLTFGVQEQIFEQSQEKE